MFKLSVHALRKTYVILKLPYLFLDAINIRLI